MRRILAALFVLLASSPVQAGSIPELFKKVSSSVVVIKTSQREILEVGQEQPVSVGGIGSGVLISRDGKVLTAAHVVQTADAVLVRFASGETVPARVVASEPAADVALLQ